MVSALPLPRRRIARPQYTFLGVLADSRSPEDRVPHLAGGRAGAADEPAAAIDANPSEKSVCGVVEQGLAGGGHGAGYDGQGTTAGANQTARRTAGISTLAAKARAASSTSPATGSNRSRNSAMDSR